MQMHQICYFLALCEERSFTRAAKRCGISQPSLTNAIIGLEQELGGALFQRKPLIALTVLGHTVHPYFERIAQNVDQAREAAQSMADVRRSPPMPLPPSGHERRQQHSRDDQSFQHRDAARPADQCKPGLHAS